MKKENFLEILKDKVLVCDGSMGTMLYSKGVYINKCFDELNLSIPSLVEGIHQEYLDCGVDIIETNTFGANIFKLKNFGFEDKVQEINYKGVKLLKKLIEKHNGKKPFIAGSIGPLGLKIEPWGPTSVEEAEEAYKMQVEALLEGGVDLFILETFSDINLIHQAIKAIKKLCDYPIISQMTIGNDGNSLYGTTPEIFTNRLDTWGADVIGLNCSVGPQIILEHLEKMIDFTDKPLSAQPNAGIPKNVGGRNLYMCSPEYFAEYGKRLIQSGVQILGGCCGTTPKHIRAMIGAVRALRPNFQKHQTIKNIKKKADDIKIIPVKEKSSFAKKIAEKKFVVSIEITPPHGWNSEKVLKKVHFLKEHNIDAINIPDGPRASARLSPIALASIIANKVGIEPVLHYCCRDRNLLGLQSGLMGAYALDIRNVLIVTGDPPKLGNYPDATAVFDVDSIGATNMATRLNHGLDIGGTPIGDPTGFFIGVGANPGAIDIEEELRRFEYKVEAGAEFAITQPVFDLDLLYKFLKRIEHCRIPIIAGIWPLTSLRNAEFMNNEVPGANVPEHIMKRMAKCKTKEEGSEEGLKIAREMLLELKDVIDGVQVSAPFGRVKYALKVLSVLPGFEE